jgi:hypothetical protein
MARPSAANYETDDCGIARWAPLHGGRYGHTVLAPVQAPNPEHGVEVIASALEPTGFIQEALV